MSHTILIIGATPTPGRLKTYGGATVLLSNFVEFCHRHNYDILYINTYKYRSSLANALYVLTGYFICLFRARYIMFNVSYNGAFKLFFHLAPIAFFFRKKVIFRKFGGFFDDELSACPARKRVKMVGLLKKSSLVLVETQRLVEAIGAILAARGQVLWFPNSRRPALKQLPRHVYKKRFVFMSHIREEKGVDSILRVAEALPSGYVVDLYGSIQEKKYEDSNYFRGKRAQYKGAISSDQVLFTLSQYDVLLLPTTFRSEGYPGIIIEAMSLGIPVIATDRGGIPEIVLDRKNGLIIPVRDDIALREAMLSINEESYKAMSEFAYMRFNECYNSENVNNLIYRKILGCE